MMNSADAAENRIATSDSQPTVVAHDGFIYENNYKEIVKALEM